MTVGLATADLANKMLDLISTASQSGYSTPHLALHTGDPGAAGASNASAETARMAVTFGAASGGSKAATGSPVAEWTAWDVGTETISHLSIWSAASAGTFIASVALTTPRQVDDTDTFRVTALSISQAPLAA